jgi:hypothetical protein
VVRAPAERTSHRLLTLWCGLLLAVAAPTAAAAAPGASTVPPDPVPVDHLADAILRAAAWTDGTRGPLLHAFIDPSCIACVELRQRLKGLIRDGQLRVRWIPVQATRSDSPAGDLARANTALLKLLTGAVRTPTLAYWSSDGALHVRVGAPPDVAQWMRELH